LEHLLTGAWSGHARDRSLLVSARPTVRGCTVRERNSPNGGSIMCSRPRSDSKRNWVPSSLLSMPDTPYEIKASPEPGPPVTVGLDGGYIRGRERRPRVGRAALRSSPARASPKRAQGVCGDEPDRYETEASIARSAPVARGAATATLHFSLRRRRYRTRITRLPTPHSEHILDWFHIPYS